MKLKWPLGLLALLFFVGLFTYYGWFYKERLLYKAIPNDAVLIMELYNVDSLQHALHDNVIWSDLEQVDWISKVDKTYKALDTVFLKERSGIREKLLASLHVTKYDDYEVLLIFDKELLKAPLDLMVRQLQNDQPESQLLQRTVRGTTVYEIVYPRLGKRISLATKASNFVASFSSHLVDESIVDYREGTSRYWNMTRQTSATADARIYFNFPKFALLNSLFLKKEGNTLFQLLSDQLKWMHSELNFHNKGLGFNGNILLNKQHEVYNWVLRQESSGEMEIPRILPANTAFLMHYNVADYGAMHRHLGAEVNSKFEAYGIDWMGKEWAFGLAEPTSHDPFLESFIVTKVSDLEGAKEAVAKLTTIEGPVRPSSQYKTFQVENGDASIIAAHFFGKLVGEAYHDAYYAFVDDFLLIASTQRHLTMMLKKYSDQKTLDRFEDFTDYVANRDSSSNMLCYTNVELMKQLFIGNASTSFKQSLNLYFDSYKKITPIVCQFNKEHRQVVADGLIGYANPKEVAKTLLWSKQLGDKIIMPPQVVVNYRTKEKEILVQDQSNKLYLLSKNGKVIWEKDVESPILGKVHQIDYHNNGELQFLFNTASKVFIFDQNGADAYDYPIRLARKAIGGLSVTKTSNRHINFDYFVPCANKQLYGYRLNGVPLDRWQPKRGLSSITHPILYFEHQGKENIVIVNDKGSVFFYDRDGKQRAKAYIGHEIIGTPEIDEHGGEPKVVLLASNGKTYFVNRFGEKTSNKLTPRSDYMQFLSDNVLGDSKQEELVYISDNQVYICNEREPIAKYDFPEGAIPKKIFPVENVLDKSVKRIGIFCENTEQIFLLGKYGKIDTDFPLPATTPFVITDLLGGNQNILVAGGKDNNVFAYKLK